MSKNACLIIVILLLIFLSIVVSQYIVAYNDYRGSINKFEESCDKLTKIITWMNESGVRFDDGVYYMPRYKMYPGREGIFYDE